MVIKVNGRKLCRRYTCILLVLVVLIHLYMDAIVDRLVYSEHQMALPNFVNTKGCRIRAMPLYPSDIMRYFNNKIIDECEPRLALTKDSSDYDNNYLEMNIGKEEAINIYNLTSLADVNCSYSIYERIDDHSSRITTRTFFKLSPDMKLKIIPDTNFVLVLCKALDVNSTIIYAKVHIFVKPPKEVVELKSEFNSTHQTTDQTDRTSDQISVMVVGLDSMSHMHFLRSLPRTTRFLRQRPHVEFMGHNRVAGNTFPNLMPMLTGRKSEEITSTCGTKYFDTCDLIWKHYKDRGYNTVFGEDAIGIGTFVYQQYGFKQEPTDYYLRPAMMKMRYHKYSTADSGCNWNNTFSDVLWEFAYKILPHMKIKSFFSFLWWVQGIHDAFNYAKLFDDRFEEMLQQLDDNGILNKTFVLVISDHGLRFGPFRRTNWAMLEENLPAFFAIYPQWLQDAYPKAFENLQNNQNSLTTHFDVHATLLDLVDLNNLKAERINERHEELRELGKELPRSISLFLPIPGSRTCESALIPDHFCSCHTLSETKTSDHQVQVATRFVVRTMNNLLKSYPQCQKLQLEMILKAYVWNRDKDVEHSDVMVQIQTLPGKGIFEATVQFTSFDMALGGPVTRINKYANQSYCVQNPIIEVYCFCLDATPNSN